MYVSASWMYLKRIGSIGPFSHIVNPNWAVGIFTTQPAVNRLAPRLTPIFGS